MSSGTAVWLWAAGVEEAVQRAVIVAGCARAVRGAALGRGADVADGRVGFRGWAIPQASAPPAFGVFHDLRLADGLPLVAGSSARPLPRYRCALC